MYLIVTPALLFLAFLSACSSSPVQKNQAPQVDPSTAVTIETSGDLFHAPDGESYWVQFFGRCEKNEEKVIVEANSVISEAPCQNFQYRYTHKIPKKSAEDKNLFWITKLHFYHPNRKQNQALSWVLFDTEKKVLKTVVNQQLRFERLPTGALSPVVEFTALGICQAGSEVTAKISGQDTYQQPLNKYNGQKDCQHGSFYFLSQMEGEALTGFKFEVQEKFTPTKKKTTVVEVPINEGSSLASTGTSAAERAPSSEETLTTVPVISPEPPRINFQWSIDLD